MRNLFRCTGLTLALLLVAGSAVRAQDPTLTVNSPSPSVTVSTLTFDGGGPDNNIPVGPFPTTITANSSPPQSLLNGVTFCVDLWHTQANGSGFNYNMGTVTNLISSIPGGVSYDSHLSADLNYLGYVWNVAYQAGDHAADAAAIQLAIWRLIDEGPSGVTTSNTTLNNDAGLILKLVTNGLDASSSVTLSSGLVLHGITSSQYLSASQYTAEYFMRNGVQTEQNLLSWAPVSVPEPSSMAIAGLGTLGMIGYGLRRRKSS